jgi:hypothetical protein
MLVEDSGCPYTEVGKMNNGSHHFSLSCQPTEDQLQCLRRSDDTPRQPWGRPGISGLPKMVRMSLVTLSGRTFAWVGPNPCPSRTPASLPPCTYLLDGYVHMYPYYSAHGDLIQGGLTSILHSPETSNPEHIFQWAMAASRRLPSRCWLTVLPLFCARLLRYYLIQAEDSE